MSTDKEKLTPEKVLMNCLEDCGRYQRILVVVETKEDCYEFWSNLDLTERVGLFEIARLRIEKKIKELEDC